MWTLNYLITGDTELSGHRRRNQLKSVLSLWCVVGEMAESRSVVVTPLNGSNYVTWKIQCRMALMKEGLWKIVDGTEVAPGEADAGYNKFIERRDKALAIVVLSVDPTLLYLIGEPTDPKVVWDKLANQFQKKTIYP